MTERRWRAAAARRRWTALARSAALMTGVMACRRDAEPHLEATVDAPDHAAPLLVLSERDHAFGQVAQGDTLRFVLTVQNLARDPVRLTTETSGGRCRGELTVPSLAAGEMTALEVTCETREHRGPLRETLIVRASGSETSEAAVRVSAEVTPALAFDTDLLAVEVAFGHDQTSVVHLVGARAKEATLRVLRVDHPFFDVRWLPGDARDPRALPQLRVRAHGGHVGYHAGEIALASGIAGVAPVVLPYALRVLGTLTVSPTNPYINLRTPGRKACTVDVDSAQPGFHVHDVQVSEGPFVAALESETEGHARVQVTVQEARLEDESRGATGRLRIRSNDRSEPLKEVPLLAFGVLNRQKADAGDLP